MRPRGVWASPLEPSALVVLGSPAAAEALTLRDSAQQLQGGMWKVQARIFRGACRDTFPHPFRGKKGFNFNDGDDHMGGRHDCAAPPLSS